MKLRLSWRSRLIMAMVAMLAASACDEGAVPTTPTGQAAQTGPVISDLEVSESGNGLVLVKVRASDPAGGSLAFSWQVDQGAVSAATGPSTLWRLPSEAGTYMITLEATSTSGQRVQASRTVQRSADGSSVATGGLQVATPGGTAGTPLAGSGRFQVPSAAPNASASVLIVGGNPAAPGTPQPTPQPGFTQPVATPVPGATPTSGIPGQPIATPTPTLPPATPTPSPTPTPRPPTPEPGVPVPPPSLWTLVDPANVPSRADLNDVHFYTADRGWAVGRPRTAMFSSDGGLSWQLRQNGIPTDALLEQVFFTSDNVGYVTGEHGLVMRTRNGGTTWEDISPSRAFPDFVDTVRGLVVYNEQIVMIYGRQGRVFRSENANAAVSTNVSWTAIETRPLTRPEDNVGVIAEGAAFNGQADTTVSYFAGSAIYKLDTDAASPWRRVAQLEGGEQALSVTMPAANDIWVGTNLGQLYHSADSGASWNKITTFYNREHNGNNTNLSVDGIQGLSFVDGNNGWLAAGIYVLDTQNGQSGNLTWKKTQTPIGFNSIQIESRIVGGNREFFGWGVGTNGGVYRYVPGGN